MWGTERGDEEQNRNPIAEAGVDLKFIRDMIADR